jgi:uncharacterized membrane protein (DUF373 family)
VKADPKSWRLKMAESWRIQTAYQRFESSIAFVLTVLVSVIIVVALFRLVIAVTFTLLFGALDPLDHGVFQEVFGSLMTLLIAMEFNHTLHLVVAGQKNIIQVRVVLLIALLALARKFIVFDYANTSADKMFGLAAITLVLGCSLWLLAAADRMRKESDRSERLGEGSTAE